MKHVTMAEKSLLIGDEAADALTEYAALVAKIGGGDQVKLQAVGADGDEVTVTFVLNSGTVMLAETSRSTLPEPKNDDAVRYMRSRLNSFGDASAIDEAHTGFTSEV
jgi:hypothetical protein